MKCIMADADKQNNCDGRGRLFYLDNLRIVTALAVVFIHIESESLLNRSELFTLPWYVLNFYSSVVRWVVPVFVMISGSLFLKRDISIRKIYTKYIPRLAVSFIVWSVIYAMYFIEGDKATVAFYILTGHYHLWYCVLAIGLYAFTPFLREIVKSEKLTKYYLILSAVLAFVLPDIISVLNHFPIRYSKIVSPAILYHLQIIHPEVVGAYGFYYVMGYYLCEKRLDSVVRKILYVLGWAGVAATFLFTVTVSKMEMNLTTDYYTYESLRTALSAVAVFVFAKQHFTKGNRVTILIGKATFSIYLMHLLVLGIIENNFTFNMSQIIYPPVMSVIVFLICLVIAVSYELIKGKFIKSRPIQALKSRLDLP